MKRFVFEISKRYFDNKLCVGFMLWEKKSFIRYIPMEIAKSCKHVFVPSDGVDRYSGGESGHLIKMSLLALRSF